MRSEDLGIDFTTLGLDCGRPNPELLLSANAEGKKLNPLSLGVDFSTITPSSFPSKKSFIASLFPVNAP